MSDQRLMLDTMTGAVTISKTRLWTGRVIGAWLVLFLAFDGAVKALKMTVAVEGTTRLGYPEHVIVSLGIIELICLVAYLVPRTSVVGVVLLTGYLGGAAATQVRVQDPWFPRPVAIGALMWLSLWLRNPRIG